MLKIRRPLGRLIFNMGIAIPGKTVFLIETAPWSFCLWVVAKMANDTLCFNIRKMHVLRKYKMMKCIPFLTWVSCFIFLSVKHLQVFWKIIHTSLWQAAQQVSFGLLLYFSTLVSLSFVFFRLLLIPHCLYICASHTSFSCSLCISNASLISQHEWNHQRKYWPNNSDCENTLLYEWDERKAVT